MAQLFDLPKEHRSYVDRIPVKLLEQLSAEELRHRVKHVARIEGDADRTVDRDASSALRAHARSILHAIPLPDYLAEHKRLNAAIHHADNTEVRSSYHQAVAELKDKNAYPAGLVEAADRRMTGKSPDGVVDCDVDAILGISAEKAARPKVSKAAREAQIKKAVAKATAKLEADQARLRAEIAAFKRERGIR